MYFFDANGNPIPTAVTVDANGDGLEVFAVDAEGNPLECIWVLTNRGGQQVVGTGSSETTISAVGNAYFGALDGFSSPTYAPIITVGPSTSTVYYPPPQDFYSKTINAVLTAVPTNGYKNRSLYIEVQRSTPSF
jgi:hypothetical protein